jgi:hypothetical protein
VRSAAAAWQRVDGEMVLMQADAGELLGLNPVGARAWELVDGVRSLDEIAGTIAVEFGADERVVLRDLETFFGELTAARLSELIER